MASNPPEETAVTAAPLEPGTKTRAAKFRAYIAESVRTRETLLKDWRENVTYRVMKPFGSDIGTDVDRVAVPEDWTRTKQKTAQLAFQLPKIVTVPGRPEDVPFVPTVTAAVNTVLKKDCRLGFVVDECLADVINAAGLMAAVYRVDRPVTQIQVPALAAAPPEALATGVPAELPPPPMVPAEIAKRYVAERISPSALLWPSEFTGSDWKKPSWLGYESLLPVEVIKKHPKWGPALTLAKPDFKGTETTAEHLAKDVEAAGLKGTMQVAKVTTVYYKAWEHDDDARHPDHLRIIVFIDGVDTPVEEGDIDEQGWTEATIGMDGAAVAPRPTGLTRFPIIVETLTYVSDTATPPSDTQAGRSQVRELMRSRSQMLRQRDSSIPIRWYDTNRIDEDVMDKLRSGEYQDIIPINGPGERAIGEVARANYPRENVTIMTAIGQDLDRSWALSNNGLAQPNSGERSATEINAVQSAGAVRLDYEKGRVNRFVAEGACVLWQLMSRYMMAPDYVKIVGANGAEALAQFDPKAFAGDYSFDFVPDSGDRLDAATRQANSLKMYNIMANSPTSNRKAQEEEVYLAHGYDPAKFMTEPPPPKEEKPTIGYSFKGEDMTNPVAVALLIKNDQITPAEIKAAILLIQDAVGQVQVPQPIAPDAAAGAPPDQGALPFEEVTPPTPTEPILKRLNDGTRMS